MKILHVIEDISSSSGGPSISALSMASAIGCIDDNQIGLLCYKKDGHDITIENSKGYPGYSNIKWHLISKNGFLESIFAIRFANEFLKVLPNYDVVSIHGSWLPSLLITGLLSRLNNKHYIVVPHGMLDPWTLAYKKWKKFFVWHLLWKRIVNSASMIRALTSDEKKLMTEIGITAPIEVVANGIFQDQFNKLQSLPLEECNIDVLNKIKKPYILFLSRIHFKKGLDILIRAFSLVAKSNSEISLVIAGPDENYWNEANSLIQKLDLNQRVNYIGPIYGYDKFLLLKNSTCFCLPSRQEGFSMAIIEAMTVSTPIIISKDCHFNEVEDHNAGIVSLLEPTDVAAAILEIINNPSRAIEIGRNASHLINTDYTWEALSYKLNKYILMYT